METLITSNRRHWIDNLRWITILIVVIFHIFFFYNDIGVSPMFVKPGSQTESVKYTFAGIFQYSVYQWFMALLFVVSGICAKYTLQKKTLRQFLKDRTRKLLVPGTLGVLCVHWIAGWLESSMFMPEDVPLPVKLVVSFLSGTGGLWFCHVLIIACVVLALIKVLDKNNRLEALGEKSNMLILIFLYPVMLGAAQILNVPMVTTYRMCYYPVSFLAGYYIFSSEKLLAQLKKFGWIFLIPAAVACYFYIKKFYGVNYSSYEVLNDWLSILFTWLMIAGIISLAQNVLDFENKFSAYMNSVGWGIYINHITLMIIINYFLRPYTSQLSMLSIYTIEFSSAMILSIALWELLKRVPVLRYVLYGIKGNKNA